MNYQHNRLNKIIHFWGFFQSILKKSQNISLKADNIKIEFEAFLREPITDIESDPLQWWKSKASIYPNVSLTVTHYMHVHSSNFCTQWKSVLTAGNLVISLRQRRTPENVEMLMFLNKNYKFDKPIVKTKWMFLLPLYWTKKPFVFL